MLFYCCGVVVDVAGVQGIVALWLFFNSAYLRAMVEEYCLEVLLTPDCRLLALDDDDGVGGGGRVAL